MDFDVSEQPHGGKVFPTMMGWAPRWISSCHYREAGTSNSGIFLSICGCTGQKANTPLCVEDTLAFQCKVESKMLVVSIQIV